jgi:UDP-N-acetylmuramoyl-L-alanyl-D-glutamate--2,6-diaminopimelate ligase
MVMPNGRVELFLRLVGLHNVYNALGAAAAALSLGASELTVASALEDARGVPGRLEQVDAPAGIGNRIRTFVDYAHTPDALEKVCATLAELAEGRLHVVFGCGGDRDRTKRAPMAKAAEEGSDVCILTSDNPRTESAKQILTDTSKGFQKEGHAIIEDREQAIHFAISNAEEGDVIVIAGKGHEAYQEINGTRYDFDDRIIAKAIVRSVLRTRQEARERDNFRR